MKSICIWSKLLRWSSVIVPTIGTWRVGWLGATLSM
jgi:hypothetical protein